MRPFSIAILALLSGFVTAQTQCVDGIKFFIPRGTGEPEGPGAVGRLGEAVQALIPGSDIEAINYPASLIDPMYFFSVINGTLALREAIVSYAEACPGGKMVITGASQGAHVVSNAICGTGYILSPGNLDPTSVIDFPGEVPGMLYALPLNVTKDVVAIVAFTDPTRLGHSTWNYGTASSKYRGFMSRTDDSQAACDKYGTRIRSYCDEGDSVCADGTHHVVGVHESYLDTYLDEVVEYIVGQYEASQG